MIKMTKERLDLLAKMGNADPDNLVSSCIGYPETKEYYEVHSNRCSAILHPIPEKESWTEALPKQHKDRMRRIKQTYRDIQDKSETIYVDVKKTIAGMKQNGFKLKHNSLRQPKHLIRVVMIGCTYLYNAAYLDLFMRFINTSGPEIEFRIVREDGSLMMHDRNDPEKCIMLLLPLITAGTPDADIFIHDPVMTGRPDGKGD